MPMSIHHAWAGIKGPFIHYQVIRILIGPYSYGQAGVYICPHVFAPYMGRHVRAVYTLILILSGSCIYGQTGICICLCLHTISGPEHKVRSYSISSTKRSLYLRPDCYTGSILFDISERKSGDTKLDDCSNDPTA